jgi:hypothetical protein
MTTHPVYPAKRCNNVHLSAERSNTTPLGAQASDAEVVRINLLARDAIPYFRRSSLCLCLHCLTRYADHSSLLASALVSEFHRQAGYSAILNQHHDGGTLYPLKTGLGTDEK